MAEQNGDGFFSSTTFIFISVSPSSSEAVDPGGVGTNDPLQSQSSAPQGASTGETAAGTSTGGRTGTAAGTTAETTAGTTAGTTTGTAARTSTGTTTTSATQATSAASNTSESPPASTSSVSEKHSSTHALPIIIAVIVAVLVLLLAALCYFRRSRLWRSRRKEPRLDILGDREENRAETPSGSEVVEWAYPASGYATQVCDVGHRDALSTEKTQPSLQESPSLVRDNLATPNELSIQELPATSHRASDVLDWTAFEEEKSGRDGAHNDLLHDSPLASPSASRSGQPDVSLLQQELEQMRRQVLTLQTQVVNLSDRSQTDEAPPLYFQVASNEGRPANGSASAADGSTGASPQH